MEHKSDGQHHEIEPFLARHPPMHADEDKRQGQALTHDLGVENKILKGEDIDKQEEEIALGVFAGNLADGTIDGCTLDKL